MAIAFQRMMAIEFAIPPKSWLPCCSFLFAHWNGVLNKQWWLDRVNALQIGGLNLSIAQSKNDHVLVLLH
jgi:hypothetical protein